MTFDLLQEHENRLRAAETTIRNAFQAAGVALRSEDDWYLRKLSHWYQGPNSPDIQYQDPHSRHLVQTVRAKAIDLMEAISEAHEYSGFDDPDWPNAESEKLNLCELFFSEDPEAEFVLNVWAIAASAEELLKYGKVPQGRGRPPLIAYYRFVRELHDLYFGLTGKKGFYEKAGSAEGAFIDLVASAQAILPSFMRLRERTTIANRVLQAFTAENQPEQ
jgi:hypothetical protein